eukprot:scaffold64968_cov70-Cyclotella_meneghiniana.AAC.7
MGDIETMLMMFGCIVLLFYETKIDIKRLELGMMTVVNIIKAIGDRRVNVRGLELGMSTVVNFEAIGEYVEKGLM